jgi:CRP-like cAMP-binding protein
MQRLLEPVMNPQLDPRWRNPLEQRLCRWLLLCHDRVNGSEILMTQEFIANMVGGRRESVTIAAGHLQDAGLIQYSRGVSRSLIGTAWKK